jgi:hypothetical protein
MDDNLLGKPGPAQGLFRRLDYWPVVVTYTHSGSKPPGQPTVPYPHQCGVAWETRFA